MINIMTDIELPISPEEKKKAARFYYFQFLILLLALFPPLFDVSIVETLKSKFLQFHRQQSNRLALVDGLMILLVLVGVIFPAYFYFCIILIIILLCLRIILGIRGVSYARKGEMKSCFSLNIISRVK